MEEGNAMGGKENAKVTREGVKVDGQVGAELEEVDGDIMAGTDGGLHRGSGGC